MHEPTIEQQKRAAAVSREAQAWHEQNAGNLMKCKRLAKGIAPDKCVAYQKGIWLGPNGKPRSKELQRVHAIPCRGCQSFIEPVPET